MLPFAPQSVLEFRPRLDYYKLFEMDGSPDGGKTADHLCVLVHGLWGNPSHLDYVASALRERYGADRLFVLAAQRNPGSYTYDGIELGGERVAREIEETLEQLAEKGYHIKKLSVVGYSLGGLVARYAIGLLQANGWLDKVEPVNFTTFVSPHVGVRSPLKGLPNHIWNILGARTVSMSGRQMFMIDDFRGTGQPLLSLLADPNSIFMRGLAKFRHRTAYANIVNDRSTVFYTTAMSKVHPFPDPENTNFNYVKGYEPVIIDPDTHVLPHLQQQPSVLEEMSYLSYARKQLRTFLNVAPFYVFIAVFIPIGSVLFLLNSVVQNQLSQKRIRLYEAGKTDLLPGRYRVPLIVQDVRGAVEDVFENVNASQGNEYLSERDEEYTKQVTRQRRMSRQKSVSGDEKDQWSRPLQEQTEVDSGRHDSEFPILALTPAQFNIIDSLNAVGFRKYPVFIHKARHSHAAIIVRMPKDSFSEGKVVVRHWLDKEFHI
ncbi:putative lipase/serine esterase [Talaromyces proteolyticus]|uniref:Lipase/serine esterase n=1 Tax=Talaromyces proteolyticus TaxID=1131652 RepID=A0AAD4KMX7_9EURO|nr:putative lipase/serine esterase [Talaromyces proteolyticus]KAH8695565.1 putative lipase/serine esterase [Talaromyces proteolyticus]